MAYPEDVLADDEELLLHRHPHWRGMVVPALIFLLATLIAGFLAGLAGHQLPVGAQRPVLGIVALVWVVLVFWRCVVPLMRWRSTHFIVTSRRVLVREGVVTHTGLDIALSRISDVKFRRGPLDRLLGTGTLILSSASDEPLEFDHIPDVQQVHALLYREVFDRSWR